MDLNATAVLGTREVRFAQDGSGSYSWDLSSKADQIDFGPNGIMTLSLTAEAVTELIDAVPPPGVTMRNYIKGFALAYAQAHPEAVQFQRLSPVVVREVPVQAPAEGDPQ